MKHDLPPEEVDRMFEQLLIILEHSSLSAERIGAILTAGIVRLTNLSQMAKKTGDRISEIAPKLEN